MRRARTSPAATVLVLLLIMVACTSVRDTKSDVVGEYGALTRRAEQVHAQWVQASAMGRESKARVDAFNAFWLGVPSSSDPVVALGFRGRSGLIREALQTTTPDSLIDIRDDIARLRSDLERWALDGKGGS